MRFILEFLGTIFLNCSFMYIWSKLLNKKINYKDFKSYILIIILSLVTIINYNNIPQIVKVGVITVLMALFIKLIFKTSIKNGLITSFFTQILNIIPELIYSIILVLIFGIEFDKGSTSILVTIIADFFVGTFNILVANMKFIRKIYKSILNITKYIVLKHILIYLLPIIFIFNAYLASAYQEINFVYLILLNNTTIYIIVIMLLISIKKENEYLKISNKYNTTLNSLKEYEDMLDKYRLSSHENKNLLLTLRNMIPKSNKSLIKNVDKLINNKTKDDDKIMPELSIIPAGGIRGLIYSKILCMKEKNIEYNLDISKDIKTFDLINKLDDDDILDICKVIGVYIDNSIDEVSNMKKKYINLSIYLKNKYMVITISNNYKSKIDLDKIEQKGYTTKGNSHGYGLSLAKQIIDDNKKLENEKQITKTIFTQVLKVKI